MRSIRSCLAAMFLAALPSAASAAPVVANATPEQVNETNNPLSVRRKFEFHDHWQPLLEDFDGAANRFKVHSVGAHKPWRTWQLLELTFPNLVTVYGDDARYGSESAMAELAIRDLFLLKRGATEFALGPEFSVDLESLANSRAPIWRGGFACAVVSTSPSGLTGGVVSWQKSLSPTEYTNDVSHLTFQPYWIRNFPQGLYFRSTGKWEFELVSGRRVVPIGVGLGKVLAKQNGQTINLFLEPQWTVYREGRGQPLFQLYAGVSLQSPVDL